MQDSIYTLLPPLVAIIIAIWRKNAMFALLCGLILCHFMLMQADLLSGVYETVLGVAHVFSSLGNLYIVGFSLLIGALVTLSEHSGAVNGFINNLAKRNLVKNSRQASLLPTVIGTGIFTDTNLSMFAAGMASQKIFDQHQLSRARLAYLIDSTCAPVSILFLINGWGAYVLGLLDGYSFADPVGILVSTIAYNFYAIIALVLAYFTAFSGKVFGAMKHQEALINQDTESQESQSSVQNHSEKIAPAWFMWLPMLTMLAGTFVLLLITGNGDLRRGSGAFSVFWSVFTALSLQIILIYWHKVLSKGAIAHAVKKGIVTMVPAVTILVLSFAFGDAVKALGTGHYVSQLISVDVPLYLLAPVLFIAAGIMAFATGTSWGTFAILIPIAVPIAQQTGLPLPLLISAVLGGGVFGDHASPISDTTVVASIASGCDHYQHVKTQLPYTLFAAFITIILYILIGLGF